MKGRLFSATMFLLVLVLGLAVPVSAAPRPVQSLTVGLWHPTDELTTYDWNFEALDISWEGYKPATVELGHLYCDTPGCPNLIAYPDAVQVVNAKTSRYPQNLDLRDASHYYNITASGCFLEQYVRLVDSQGLELAIVRGPSAPYCIVQLP